MRLHEGRCIRNPGRTCGFCDKAGFETHPIPELVTAAAGGGVYAELRKLTENCPACLLAGIVNRHAQFPDERDSGHLFNFKAEVERFTNEQREHDERIAEFGTYYSVP